MKFYNLNLYLVDDDKDVRDSLAAFFIARHFKVQVFESGESFLKNADVHSSGCVLLDIDMDPGLSGLKVFDELRSIGSPLVVILLSGVLNVPTATAYMDKGVFYCLEKTCDESFLLQRVELALERAEGIRIKGLAKMSALMLWEDLTPTEMDVARIDRRGLLNKQIADELGKNVRTIETHKSHFYKKLRIRSSAELDRFMRDNDIE